MSVSRRRFLAALAVLPFAGKSLELLTPEPELEGLKLVRYTRRLEITEEALEATQGNREAFEEWAEEAIPGMGEDLVTFYEHYGPGERKPLELVEFQEEPELDDLLEGALAGDPFEWAGREDGSMYFDTHPLWTRPS